MTGQVTPQMGNEKKNWLFIVYIGDYTTQLCGDDN